MSDEEIVVKLTADPEELKTGAADGAEAVVEANEAMAASAEAAAATMKAAAVDVAESNAAASSRIKDMVAASLAAAAAANTSALSDRALREAKNGVTEATAEQVAASAALRAAQEAQMVPMADYIGAEAIATEETVANTAATRANEAAQAGLNSKIASGAAVREYSALVDEAISGNYRRMTGTVSVLANRLGILGYAFSAIGAYVAASVAAIGLLITAMVKGSEESERFEKALVSTGGYAGITEDQFRSLAEEVSDAGNTIGKSKDVLIEVAGTGRFTADQLAFIGKAALDMARVTGLSVQQAVNEFVKLQDEPVKAAEKLNEQYHFLTAAVFENIMALEEQGQKQQAAAVLEKALGDAFAERSKTVTDNLGTWSKLWNGVKSAASSAWDAMMGDGRKLTLGDQVAAIGKEIDRLQAGYISAAGVGVQGLGDSDPKIVSLKKQRDALIALEQEQQKQAADASKNQQVQDAYVAAAADIDHMEESLDKAAKKQAEINKLNQDFKAIAAANPGQLQKMGVTEDAKGDFSGGEYDQLYQAIEAKYKNHIANMKTLDDEELRELEAKDKVSANNRIQFELEFWQKKLSAVKAGTAEYANAYQKVMELQEKADQRARDSAKTSEEIRTNAAMAALSQEEAAIRQKASLNELSITDEYSQLLTVENQKYALQQQSLAREKALYDQGTQQYNAMLLKEQQLLTQHEATVTKLENEAVQQQVQRYRAMMAPVNAAVQSSINGIIQGTTTGKQAMANLALSIVDEFVAKGVEMVTNWIANEAAKTSATSGAEASRSSIKAAAATEDRAVVVGNAIADITSYAAVAAAAAASSVADIPIIGWAMAPGVAAETFASTMAYAGVAAAEGGWEDVPGTVLTMLHPHEMVLPAHIAEGARKTFRGAGAPGGGGQAGGSAGPALHFHMVDTNGLKDMLRRNPRILGEALVHAGKMYGGR